MVFTDSQESGQEIVVNVLPNGIISLLALIFYKYLSLIFVMFLFIFKRKQKHVFSLLFYLSYNFIFVMLNNFLFSNELIRKFT